VCSWSQYTRRQRAAHPEKYVTHYAFWAQSNAPSAASKGASLSYPIKRFARHAPRLRGSTPILSCATHAGQFLRRRQRRNRRASESLARVRTLGVSIQINVGGQQVNMASGK
jgi:hypothetical protein